MALPKQHAPPSDLVLLSMPTLMPCNAQSIRVVSWLASQTYIGIAVHLERAPRLWRSLARRQLSATYIVPNVRYMYLSQCPMGTH
jgi:hypothetical protein